MNHTFIPSALSAVVCATCKKDAIAHTDMATCEACENVGPVELLYGTMLMCESCRDKEKSLQAANNTPVKVSERIENVDFKNRILEQAKQIDDNIQVRTDLFNAATVSIVELKSAIDADDNITNKPYELAKVLSDRFNHFKQVTFDLSEKLLAAGNEQKAIQVYLNQLANQLRAEEREKLKIQDINYKPVAVKTIKPAAIKTAKKKLDKAELKKYATELGINEFTLQMLVVSKGLTVEQAANMLRKSINEAKSENE